MNSNHKYFNWIYGVMLSLCLVLGYEAQLFGEIKINKWWTYALLILIAVGVSFGVKKLWRLLASRFYNTKITESTKAHEKLYISATILIWILHFIVFLGVFPGFFVYDAQDELFQTITRSFNDRHPMIHVLSMGGVVQLFHKVTGSYNVGIAAFILIGMTLSALTYGYLVYTLRTAGLSKRLSILYTLYLGLFPVIVMYSLCSAKDGIFGMFLIISVILIKKMTDNPDSFFATPIPSIKLAFSLMFMMLFRNNGVYAFVVFLVVAVVVFHKAARLRQYTVKFFGVSVFAIIAYILINSTLLFATNAADVGHKEILSVPIQQLARVYCYDKEALTDEQTTKLCKYIPEEALNIYNPKCSDLVKIQFNEEEYNKAPLEFYKLWLSVGVKNPVAYLNAFVMTSYGLWTPGARIDGYTGNTVFTFTYGESSYFGYETEEPGVRKSVIPIIDRIYRWISLDPQFQKIPVVHLLFSPGFILWVMLFLIGQMIFMLKKLDAMAYLLPLLVAFTCFLGPVSLVRYVFYLWVFVPMIALEINIKRCYDKKI